MSTRPLYCKRCKLTFPFPDPISQAEIDTLAQTLNQSGTLYVIKRLSTHHKLDLKWGKAIAHHITTDGHCRRCNQKVQTVGISDCPHCSSLNIYWPMPPSRANSFSE